MDDDVALDRVADEGEVADHVENLVADELVLEPQRVEDAGLPEHDRVLERAAERQALLAQHLDFLQEAERPRRRDLVHERLLIHVHRLLLVTEERVVEADRVGDAEAIGREERDALVALLNLDLTKDLDRLARHTEVLHARVLNQVDPGGGAAVHDRHFGVIELDERVVDPQGAQGREQVLDRFDRGLANGQSGLQLLPAAQMGDVRWNLDAAKVDALEANTVVGWSRAER